MKRGRRLKGDDTKLITVERKVFRKIYGPTYNVEVRQCEKKTFADVDKFYNESIVKNSLVSKRLEWTGRIWRAKESLIRQVQVTNQNKTFSSERPRSVG